MSSEKVADNSAKASDAGHMSKSAKSTKTIKVVRTHFEQDVESGVMTCQIEHPLAQVPMVTLTIFPLNNR